MKLFIHIPKLIACCILLAVLNMQEATAQAPTVTGFAPSSAAVGATLTITGTNFNTTDAANNVVFFGPVKATATAVNGAGTTLTVTVPSGAGYGTLYVLNTVSGLSASSLQFFTPVFSPNKPLLIAADITRQSTIAAGTNTRIYSLATSDLNNDGKPDLVMTSGNTDNLVFFRANTSSGEIVSFGSTTSIAVSGGLSMTDVQMSVGDLDGDARPDVVVPGKDAGAFTILKNNGSMSFTSSIVNSGSNPTGSAITDFDNDGRPDIAIAANANLRAFVFPNTTVAPGAISMGSGITLTGNSNIQEIYTADIDGDGKQDIIAPYGTWRDIGVFRNTSSVGAISFAGVQNVPVFSSGNIGTIMINDLDGDGKPDLVITNANFSTTSFEVLRNTSTVGSISFSATTVSFPYGQTYASIGDMNGDGRADLVFNLLNDFGGPTATKYRIAVMNNTSLGGSISFDSPITVGTNASSLPTGFNVVNDFNGDGRPDIIAAHSNVVQLSIFTSTPQFAPTITSFSPTVSAIGATMTITGTGFHTTPSQNTVFMGAARATVTGGTATTLTATIPAGSSHAPITVTNRTATLTGQSIQSFIPAFLPNKPTIALTDFTLQGTITPSGSSMYGMAAGDLNGDGKPDVVETTNIRLNLLRNTSTTGALSFAEDLSIDIAALSFSNPRYPALGDLTGDGTLDIAVPVYGSDRVLVFANTGTITGFTLSGSFVTDVRPNAAAIGDIDGDGKPDIVTSNESAGTGSISVLRNTGTDINTISFATKVDASVFSNTAAYTLTLADMDGDGKLDVITGDYTSVPGSSRISVFRNTSTPGTISFAARQDFSALNGVWAATAGDLNGDGKPDLVVSHATSNANSITVFRNTSTTGTIGLDNTGLNFTIGRGQRLTSLADMNGDGRLDVVSSVQEPITSAFVGDYKIAVFPNTSSGGTLSLGTSILLPMATLSHTLLTSDFNADGKPDIISGNNLEAPLTLYRNILVAPPLVQASNLIATTLATSATLSWTNGGGSRHAVFVKADITGTAAPVDLTDYTANTVLGSGSQISSTGWYCVYDGTGTSVTITGLTPSTTYRAMVTGYNNGGFANNAYYQTAAATNNPLNFTARATLTTISRTAANPVNTGTVTYAVTFGSAVTNLSTSNFTLTTSGITGASVTSVSGSGTNYTVTVNTGTGNGTIVLNLANATGLTPDLTNTLPFAGESYSIDKTAPTLSPVTIVSDNANTAKAKIADIVTISFTSNETIATPTVTIAGNTAAVTNTGGDNWAATYTMTGTDADGVVAFNIAFTDAAGNTGTLVTATTNSSSVVFDKTVPALNSVAIASNNGNTSRAKVGDIINLSFTSNEAIATPAVTIAGNAATITNTGGNNWSASYIMTGSNSEGSISFNIGFDDISGNAGTVVNATTNSSSVVFDKTIPILSNTIIASSNNNTSRAKVGDVITLQFTASETIAAPSILIATHAVTAINTSGNIWSAVYTMTGADAEGTVPFSIDFSDVSGNSGTTVSATSNSSSVVFDKTIPILSNTTIASNNSNTSRAKAGDVITLQFTASETIVAPTVFIATHAVTAINTSGNIWSAVYTMTGTDAEGTIPFSIDFSDVSGNAGTTVSATSNSSSVVFDKTNPTLSNVTLVSNNNNTSRAKTGDVITLQFTASETIAAPTVLIATHSITVINTSGNIWSATYTMTGTDAEGIVPFSIGFNDVSGNAGTTVSATTNSSSVMFDKTIPILSNVAIASNNSNTSRAKTGDVITLQFTASETIAAPTVLIATHTVTAINTSGNIWSATYTMTGADAEGTVTFSIGFNDVSGNAGTTVSATSNSSAVGFDKTIPTLSNVTIASNNNNASIAKIGDIIRIDFTASESLLTPVVLIAMHGITPVNTTGNAWAASYTITGTDAEGTVPFSIAFNDVSGNAGAVVTASTNNSSVVFDKTIPTLNNVIIASNNALTTIALVGNIVTVSFAASESITPVVTIASHAVTPVNASGNAWTASYTMQNADTEGTVAFSITATDKAGNTTTAITATTDNSSVNFIKSGTPVFTNGTTQSLVICEGVTAGINNLLAITHTQANQQLSITVIAAPANGTLAGFAATVTSNGNTVTPSGLSYQPSAGFTGTDVFTVQVTNGVITSSTTIQVTVNAKPVANSISGSTTLCAGSSLILTTSGGDSYRWYRDGGIINGATVSQLTVTVEGQYTAVIANSAGCETPASNNINVALIQQPKADFTTGAINCTNLPLTIANASVVSGSGSVDYAWDNGNGTRSESASPSFTYTQPGTYHVKLKVIPQLCPAIADSITKQVIISQPITGIRNTTVDIALNETAPLQVRTLPNVTYQWIPGRFLQQTNIPNPSINASAEQEYQIRLTTPNGCVTVDTLLVRVHQPLSVYLPNVFTPNGDVRNDVLMPIMVGIKQMRYFRIYNRLGRLVFETTNMNQGWDGKYNGVLQPMDTYTWSIEGMSNNNALVKRQGSVSLLR